MNMVEGKIVHLLTGKNSLDEVTVNELKSIADRQPYFSVAQLLLAKKMKQDNHPEYLQQVQKTALYFPNVHWLHYQLNNEFDGNERPVIEPSETPETNSVSETSKEEILPTAETENQISSEADQETKPIRLTAEDRDISSHVLVAEKPIIEFIQEEEEQEERDEQEDTTQQTNDLSPASEETQTPKISVDREIFIPATESSEPDAIMESSVDDEEDYDDEVNDTEGDLQTHEPDEVGSRLANIIEQQVSEFNKEITPESKLPIEPEPYHTVDYFASQGIRLNAQQMQQDQLGSRVRKFTDWLKQMKRVQTEPADLGTDPELENVVQDIAANSNEAREIVTEAMAEVLVKQGKLEKATQLYIKLSFLNPDKSAYFAAKIQELKGI